MHDPVMIETHGLTKNYGDKLALDGLDLEIRRGELFCFLGPNGAGKTTTIKILTGLVRPTQGHAAVGGHDVVTDSLAAKAILGYVPDTPHLYDKLTGREFMHFVAGVHRLAEPDAHQRSDDLLEQFEIAGVADRLIESYSHGMRQKLSFAACFLPDPKVAVIDEPWVGLDPKNIRAVKDDLKDRTRAGLTVLMSTHTLALAEEMADRVGILHQGRLRHVGTVDEIKALAARPGSLEDVFLELTRDDAAA
ncbi:MAG: ABC transporter ATP-binding protein [Acidobacteriota bacterium]